jgi:hypothetical protein
MSQLRGSNGTSAHTTAKSFSHSEPALRDAKPIYITAIRGFELSTTKFSTKFSRSTAVSSQ